MGWLTRTFQEDEYSAFRLKRGACKAEVRLIGFDGDNPLVRWLDLDSGALRRWVIRNRDPVTLHWCGKQIAISACKIEGGGRRARIAINAPVEIEIEHVESDLFDDPIEYTETKSSELTAEQWSELVGGKE